MKIVNANFVHQPRIRRILVILFGSLEYDGRVQRIIEIFSGLGKVALVDIRPSGDSAGVKMKEIDRIAVELPVGTGKVMRHWRLWLAALRMGWYIRPDVVVAENFFTTLPGWLLAKICSAALVYDAYELIIPESGRTMSRRNRFWYQLERWVAPCTDLVIAANQERAELMAEHYSLARAPTFMRNIPFQRSVTVGEKELLAAYPALLRRSQDERIIIYQGDVSLARGLGRFVEAMAHLPIEYRFVVAGDGTDLERLRTQGQPLEREKRFFTLGRVPNHLLLALTQQADIGIVTYPYKGLNNIYCAPNKVFEYAQAGLPIMATDQPPLKCMIDKYGIGELVSQHDEPDAIAKGIRRVVENRALYCERLPQFLADHRWEDEATRVYERLKNVLAAR